MKTKLYTFVLLFLTTYTFSQNQIGGKIIFSEAKANFGQVTAINNNGNFLISSASYQYSTDKKGLARVYNLQNNTWVQIGNDLLGNANGDAFGISVAMNETGNTVAVGAIQLGDGNYSGPGYVKVFRFSSGQYVQVGNDITGETLGDSFGRNIAINGDGTKIIIGAIFNDANTGSQFASVGHVRIYSFDGTNWNLMGSEIDGDMSNDNFGDSVDISKDGNRIVASASGFDAGGVNKGLIRVFEFSGGNWSKIGQDIIGSADNDRLTNVSINDTGTRVAFKNSTIVKVYEYNGAQWSQLGGDITGKNNDILTSNLDNTGNFLMVASRVADAGKGYVQVYKFENNNWIQLGTTLTGVSTTDNFGASVEIKNNYAVVGASDFNLNTPNDAGVSAYNFNNVLSIEKNDLFTEITVFPNPASDFIKINGVDIEKIEVYNIQGTLVKKQLKKENIISIKNLSKGLYILKISTINNFVINKKIMVQ